MPTYVQRSARRAPKLAVPELRRVADSMLRALRLEHAELSVLLVDDEKMRSLNREHRHKDKPTDVLSFPQPKPKRNALGMPRLLGDVVISLPTALRQARSRKRELLPEVRFLLAHGILHLIGHDHATPEEKRVMDAATRRLVRAASSEHRPAGRISPGKRRSTVTGPGKRPAKSRLT